MCKRCKALREEVRILREHAEDLLAEKRHWREIARARQGKHTKLKREYDEEVDEFNAGHDAFCDGLSAEDEPETEHDMWLPGFAWAKYLEEIKPCAASETMQR